MYNKSTFCNFAEKFWVMTRIERTQEFYRKIREEYKRLSAISEKGKTKYTQGYVISKIAQKYLRSERTIENIIYHRVK